MPNEFAADSCAAFEAFEGLTLHYVRLATVASPVVRSTCGIDGSTGQKRLNAATSICAPMLTSNQSAHIAHVRREPSLLESLSQDKERSNGRVRIPGMGRTISSNIPARVAHPMIKSNVCRVINLRVNSDHRRITAYLF